MSILILELVEKTFDKSKVLTNIFKMQAYDSVMCGCISIGFIDFLLKAWQTWLIFFYGSIFFKWWYDFKLF